MRCHLSICRVGDVGPVPGLNNETPVVLSATIRPVGDPRSTCDNTDLARPMDRCILGLPRPAMHLRLATGGTTQRATHPAQDSLIHDERV